MVEEVEPREGILGAGAGGPLTAPTPWILHSGYLSYGGGIVIGNPTGGNQGNGAINTQSIYINGVQFNIADYVPVAGGNMTGFLTLSGLPTANYHAAPKIYVDNQITTVNGTFSNYLHLIGGTVTGPIVLPADPTAALQASTKQYVDSKIGINISDAPSDGTIYGRLNAAWADATDIDVGTY